MTITSVENKKIKQLAKLKQKKYRDMADIFLVEGEHLVEEALKANRLIEIILLEGTTFSTNLPITYVSKEVMHKLTDLDTPTVIIGVCKKNTDNKYIGQKYLILDDIQDPGNLGTIIRSAVAFNITTIILSKNSVDLYNPKVIRATQGMLFHINIISGKITDMINDLKKLGTTIYGTDVVRGIDVRSLSKNEKKNFALVMGNEGNGIKKEVKSLCDKNLYIKMNNKVESLNVAVATSIILYELGDQND